MLQVAEGVVANYMQNVLYKYSQMVSANITDN